MWLAQNPGERFEYFSRSFRGWEPPNLGCFNPSQAVPVCTCTIICYQSWNCVGTLERTLSDSRGPCNVLFEDGAARCWVSVCDIEKIGATTILSIPVSTHASCQQTLTSAISYCTHHDQLSKTSTCHDVGTRVCTFPQPLVSLAHVHPIKKSPKKHQYTITWLIYEQKQVLYDYIWLQCLVISAVSRQLTGRRLIGSPDLRCGGAGCQGTPGSGGMSVWPSFEQQGGGESGF